MSGITFDPSFRLRSLYHRTTKGRNPTNFEVPRRNVRFTSIRAVQYAQSATVPHRGRTGQIDPKAALQLIGLGLPSFGSIAVNKQARGSGGLLPRPSTPGAFPPHGATAGRQRTYGTRSRECELFGATRQSLVASKPRRRRPKPAWPRSCSPACPGRHRRPAPRS
jgi:hypothetical protein